MSLNLIRNLLHALALLRRQGHTGEADRFLKASSLPRQTI